MVVKVRLLDSENRVVRWRDSVEKRTRRAVISVAAIELDNTNILYLEFIISAGHTDVCSALHLRSDDALCGCHKIWLYREGTAR